MASTRDILRRIKSVKNTKKMTKAMELVSAAKMRRAIEAVLATRTYANLSWLTVLNVAKMGEKDKNIHELLNDRKDVKKVAVILITSNRGLCGGYNSSIINKTLRSVEMHKDLSHEFIFLGRRGEKLHKRYGYDAAASFAKADVAQQVADVLPVAKLAIDDYLAGKYDKVMVAYTDFISSMKQVPRVKQLLPLRLETEDDYLGIIGPEAEAGMTQDILKEKQEKYFHNRSYEFEPSPQEVLDEMIPRLLEVQLFQALLEANASEHSARMMAMRSASDAADDMVKSLTLTYNKARQAGITQEISEIAGGAAALEG